MIGMTKENWRTVEPSMLRVFLSCASQISFYTAADLAVRRRQRRRPGPRRRRGDRQRPSGQQGVAREVHQPAQPSGLRRLFVTPAEGGAGMVSDGRPGRRKCAEVGGVGPQAPARRRTRLSPSPDRTRTGGDGAGSYRRSDPPFRYASVFSFPAMYPLASSCPPCSFASSINSGCQVSRPPSSPPTIAIT
jgi:hypothetical protein